MARHVKRKISDPGKNVLVCTPSTPVLALYSHHAADVKTWFIQRFGENNNGGKKNTFLEQEITIWYFRKVIT